MFDKLNNIVQFRLFFLFILVYFLYEQSAGTSGDIGSNPIVGDRLPNLT